MRTLLILSLAAVGCNADKDNTDDTTVVADDSAVDDSGTDDSSTDDSGTECLNQPSELDPDDGQGNVFYRSTLDVRFSQAVESSHGVAFVLTDDTSGAEHSVAVEWNASNEIATLQADGYLHPSSTYSLAISVCGTDYTAGFTTSDYGAPLTVEPDGLVDNTYVIEFGDVDFVEPEGFGALLALYLDVPILVGVNAASESELSLVGAQGRVTSEGDYVQQRRSNSQWVPTWDFTGIDFSGQPFFAADTSLINIAYSGVDIPVHNFHLEGTFSADGQSFAGGQLWGLGDTRNMGVFFSEPDNQSYVCDLVTSVGAACEPCPNDGENYCLFLRGEDITSNVVPDLVLERIDENGPIAN